MPQYDPQRSRSRQRKADDEGPAPVDALLGPAPDHLVEPLTDDVVAAPSAAVAHRPVGRSPRAVAGLVAVVGALLVVWLILRRRRGGDGEE